MGWYLCRMPWIVLCLHHDDRHLVSKTRSPAVPILCFCGHNHVNFLKHNNQHRIFVWIMAKWWAFRPVTDEEGAKSGSVMVSHLHRSSVIREHSREVASTREHSREVASTREHSRDRQKQRESQWNHTCRNRQIVLQLISWNAKFRFFAEYPRVNAKQLQVCAKDVIKRATPR
jgi:hypothetical protein